MLPSHEASFLARTLEDIEIKQAVNSFKPLKAPDPDGLHPFFYQEYWPKISHSVITFCKAIFTKGCIPKKINNTYLCLIPKQRNAVWVTHFRPISLCNTIYKIITKFIINRIKPYLSNIINPTQASFLKGRRAADNHSSGNHEQIPKNARLTPSHAS